MEKRSEFFSDLFLFKNIFDNAAFIFDDQIPLCASLQERSGYFPW